MLFRRLLALLLTLGALLPSSGAWILLCCCCEEVRLGVDDCCDEPGADRTDAPAPAETVDAADSRIRAADECCVQLILRGDGSQVSAKEFARSFAAVPFELAPPPVSSFAPWAAAPTPRVALLARARTDIPRAPRTLPLLI